MTRRGALGRASRRTEDNADVERVGFDMFDGQPELDRAPLLNEIAPKAGHTERRARVIPTPSRSRVDLGAPRRRGLSFGVRYDTEAFGRFSETIARFIGTGRFLVYQSVFILSWIIWNVAFPGASPSRDAHRLSFDPYPFQFLTLILSLQAAYAAPLILLAQNRQEVRDHRQNERDRQVASRTQAEAEFISRELASIRMALSDVATVSEVDKALERAMDRATAVARAEQQARVEKVSDKQNSDPR